MASFLPRPVPIVKHGLWSRMLLLPVHPGLWREARRWRFREILWPWLLAVLVSACGLGSLRAWQMGRAFLRAAPEYDRHFDPVVFESGTVRVEGPRLPRYEEKGRLFLVDPEETVQASSIQSPEYVLVRRTYLVRRRAWSHVERIDLADVAALLGRGPIVIRSETVLAWWAGRGVWVQLAAAVFLSGFIIAGEAIMCPFAALIAAASWYWLRGAGQGASFGESFRMTFASSAAMVVLDLALNLLGVSPGPCAGLLIWPSLLAVLSFLASFRE